MIDAVGHWWCFLETCQVCIASGLALAVLGQPARAQDTAGVHATYGAEVTLGSGHADRGFLISDRPVVQPEAWVSGGGAAFSLWSSFTLTETTDRSRPQILEMELTREHRWSHFSVAPAVTMFFYRDPLTIDHDHSIQAWVYLQYKAGPLRLFTNQSLDLQTHQGAYYGEAGIGAEQHVSPKLEVGGSFGAGWASAAFNDAYVGVRTAALNRVRVRGWLTAYINPHVYIGPHVEFSSIVNRAVRAALPQPTFFLVGLTTGVER